jgi:hypothetical protein
VEIGHRPRWHNCSRLDWRWKASAISLELKPGWSWQILNWKWDTLIRYPYLQCNVTRNRELLSIMFINCSCGSWLPIPMGKSLERVLWTTVCHAQASGYGGFGCRPQLGQNATLVELHFYHQSQNRSKLWKPIHMCCQCDFNRLVHVTYTYNCFCWGFESCFNISSSIRSSRI